MTDLSDWIAPSKLKQWIEFEIEKLTWDWPGAAAADQSQEDRPKMMLSLLAFAYATGVFNNEEVSRRCCSHAVFGLICGGHAPTAAALLSFRRRNRPLLERILAGAFLQAVGERFHLDATMLSPELERDLCDRAAERLEVARHLDIDD